MPVRSISTVQDAMALLDEWTAYARECEDRIFLLELQLSIARSEYLLEIHPPPVDIGIPELETNPFG